MLKKETISIQTVIKAPLVKVWEFYTKPEHIRMWNNASKDWHTPKAENDLRVGGKFLSRMEAKDGSAGFDFTGIYDEVKENELISYTMDDGRSVTIRFEGILEGVKIIITFEAERDNSIEMQKKGWQAILNNFKKYIEEK
jgi:uncharacterized protein YndB with AHSA1/START domain